MKRLFITIGLLSSLAVVAQEVEQDSKKIKGYYNIFSVGGISSNTDGLLRTTLSTVHGVVIKSNRIGLGIGVDGYDSRVMIPVFASISHDLFRIKENALFLQVNAGHAFWDRKRSFFSNYYNENGGFLFNPMMGYRISASRYSLYIAIGLKNQYASYTYGYTYKSWRTNSNLSSMTTVDQTMNRFVFQIGFGLH